MTKLRVRVSTALAAIFLTAATTPSANALDLGKTVRDVTRSVGGALSGGSNSSSSASSNSSTSASVGSGPNGGVKAGAKTGLLGGTDLEVNLLDESGLADVSSANEGAGGKASVEVLSRGQLASLRLDPNASVAGGGAGSGAVSEAFARSLLAGLDRLEQQALKLRCADVLRSPKAFDSELILLCRILASL